MNRRTLLAVAGATGGGALVFREELLAALEDSGEGGGEGDSQRGDFDPDEIEEHFLDRFNEMREAHGLATVLLDSTLTDMGQDHAENMAEHDYIGHTQPDSGMGIEERFERRGLLPQCELDDGTEYYYPGAENVAGAVVGRVTHPGTDETFNIRDNDDVAEFLMDSWMSSPGHRDVMVLPAVRQIGLGVAIRDDGEIFAALQFC